jgi:hypothetical protein
VYALLMLGRYRASTSKPFFVQSLSHAAGGDQVRAKAGCCRHEALSEEMVELDAQHDQIAAEAAPEFVSLPASGTHPPATLLVVAGDDPERLRSEASFASLCRALPPDRNWTEKVSRRQTISTS